MKEKKEGVIGAVAFSPTPDNKLEFDEPINIFVSKNETFTHKAFLYAKTRTS